MEYTHEDAARDDLESLQELHAHYQAVIKDLTLPGDASVLENLIQRDNEIQGDIQDKIEYLGLEENISDDGDGPLEENYENASFEGASDDYVDNYWDEVGPFNMDW